MMLSIFVLLDHLYVFFGEMHIQVLCLFFNWSLSFLLLRVLFISEIPDTICRYFSYSLNCLFTLFLVFFETHSIKLWSPAYLTSFGVHAFHVDSVKPLPSPWSWRLPLCFLLKSFIILAFIFRSLIHSSSHHADCEIWVPLPGFGPGPWQWKGQVLTTGPPRNSLIFDFLMCIYTQNFLVYLYKM